MKRILQVALCLFFLNSTLALVAQEAPAPEIEAPAVTEPAPTLEQAAAECAPSAAALPWNEPAKNPVLGCTASYNCVHGTIVNCSSPFVGTCTSSGARCGAVTCNGQTTWCPGACNGPQHCASFCDFSPNAYCDEYGCCVCD